MHKSNPAKMKSGKFALVFFIAAFLFATFAAGGVAEAADNSPSVTASHSPPAPTTADGVTISASATDDYGVTHIEIWVAEDSGSGLWRKGLCDVSGTSATCVSVSSTYAIGNYHYYAIATDTKLQTTESDTGYFTVTAPPAKETTGIISFQSSPSGAKIFLDGTDTTYTTPKILLDVTVGAHSYTLKLAGYKDETGTITVYEGSTATVSPTLTPLGATTPIVVSAGESINLKKSGTPAQYIFNERTYEINKYYGLVDSTNFANFKVRCLSTDQTDRSIRIGTSAGICDLDSDILNAELTVIAATNDDMTFKLNDEASICIPKETCVGKTCGTDDDGCGVTVSCGGACPKTGGDGDKDNVPNDLDKCPNTPKRANVDSKGCPPGTLFYMETASVTSNNVPVEFKLSSAIQRFNTTQVHWAYPPAPGVPEISIVEGSKASSWLKEGDKYTLSNGVILDVTSITVGTQSGIEYDGGASGKGYCSSDYSEGSVCTKRYNSPDTKITYKLSNIQYPPKGVLDYTGCDAFIGWACDSDEPEQALAVQFYASDRLGGEQTEVGSTVADLEREDDVGAECGGNVNHGFSFAVPESLKDKKLHMITAYAEGSSSPLSYNPLLSTITCAPISKDTTPPVRFNGRPINGRVVSNPNQMLSMTTNEIATCKYSTDAGTAYDAMTSGISASGIFHSKQFFGLPDGVQTYYIRCNDSAGNINTDDYNISFTVASMAPRGWLDSADCDTITGWTCDPDDYEQAIDVHFYNDSLAVWDKGKIGVTTANIPRELAVGGRCGDNANHGFVLDTPASLKDGESHTIYAYAIDIPRTDTGLTNPLLFGSPKTIKCASVSTASSTQLTLKSGWNQISSPISEGVSLATIAQYCTVKIYKNQKLWAWDTVAGTWLHPNSIEPFKGHWINLANDCTVPLSGTAATFSSVQLYSGWNMISANGKLSDIEGTCKGHIAEYKGYQVWNWDTSDGKWTHPDTLQSDKGYWIKANADCVMGS